MSDQQILSSNAHEDLQKVQDAIPQAEKSVERKRRDPSQGQRKKRPSYRRKEVQVAEPENAGTGEGSPKNSPSDSSCLLIGRKPTPVYVNLLKNILAQDKHEVM